MKNEVVGRINKFGKVGNIVVIVAKIICIIGIIGCLIASITFAIFPEDFIKVKFDSMNEVTVDLSTLGIELTDEEVKELENGIGENVTANINGVEAKSDIRHEDNKIIVSAATDNMEFSIKKFMVVMFMVTLVLAMMLVTLFFAGTLCKAFAKCDTPFEEGIIKKMQYLAICIIPMVILSQVTEAVANYAMSGYANFNLMIDWTAVIVIVVILALVYIFKYGAMLQQESDETL